MRLEIWILQIHIGFWAVLEAGMLDGDVAGVSQQATPSAVPERRGDDRVEESVSTHFEFSMVNPGKVLKARKSKRTSLHDKHKIERKVREHHRKERRDKKRNPHKYRKKRDPGIPNTWPFKQQLLLEQEQQREAEVAARTEAREARKRERAEQRASAARLQQAGREGAKVRRAAKRLAASFSPLHEVITSANVVLLVLDARDPASCRSLALEQVCPEPKPALNIYSRQRAPSSPIRRLYPL
eukprot:2615762-Pleurochrysis_carterae.AAC.3